MITADNSMEQEAINLAVEELQLMRLQLHELDRRTSFDRKVKAYLDTYGTGYRAVFEAIPINMLGNQTN
jgi:hypothetical protein